MTLYGKGKRIQENRLRVVEEYATLAWTRKDIFIARKLIKNRLRESHLQLAFCVARLLVKQLCECSF